MKCGNGRFLFAALVMIVLAGSGLTIGCDSGEKAVEEVTGSRAVKQYHQSKKKLDGIADQQAEKYKTIPGDEKEDEEKK